MSNESAFPITTSEHLIAHGMTLRDYFAAKAMQGILANQDVDAFVDVVEGGNIAKIQTMIAKASYEMAAAMLKERGE